MLGDFYGHTPAQALILDANAALVDQIDPSLEATLEVVPRLAACGADDPAAPALAGRTILSAQETEDVLAYLVTLQ